MHVAIIIQDLLLIIGIVSFTTPPISTFGATIVSKILSEDTLLNYIDSRFTSFIKILSQH